MTKPIDEMTSEERVAHCRERFQAIVDKFRDEGVPDFLIAVGATKALYRFARDQGFSDEATDAMLERLRMKREPN